MATPTQTAELSFRHAQAKLGTLVGQAYGEGRTPAEVKEALMAMCEGLSHLSVGLRATYALLSDVQTQLAHTRKLPGQF